jgi:hypothetical protein
MNFNQRSNIVTCRALEHSNKRGEENRKQARIRRAAAIRQANQFREAARRANNPQIASVYFSLADEILAAADTK